MYSLFVELHKVNKDHLNTLATQLARMRQAKMSNKRQDCRFDQQADLAFWLAGALMHDPKLDLHAWIFVIFEGSLSWMTAFQ